MGKIMFPNGYLFKLKAVKVRSVIAQVYNFTRYILCLGR